MTTLTLGSPGTNIAYDTATLIQVVPNLKRPTTFLLDLAFPNIVMSDDEYIAIDVDVGKRRLAPFVSPMVEGKLVEQRRIQTNIFKPAYIKDKRAPDLRRPIRRMIGERLAGSLTGADREMANLEAEMTDQIDILTRRLEWMAANALASGTVTVIGDGFPTVVVDFGRDPTLTVALTGTAQWTEANIAAGNSSPTGYIEAWQRNILKKSGAKVTDIIFTTTSWLGFIIDPLLKGVIYYPQLGTTPSVIDVGPMIETGAVFKGIWGGYRLWMYNEWYVDSGTEGGTLDKEYPMLTDGTVIMTGPDLMGTRAFGVILDPAFNYANLPFAPKTWVSEDPAQRFLMMQSSPLVIPSRVNASLGATVAAPVYN
jgi:Phage major capsid protein E